MPHDFALARIEPRPVCWNLYDTPEQAAADMERANASASMHGEPPYSVMPYAEFAEVKRAQYLAPDRNPLTEITADQFHEALNVLPPLAWERAEGVERFILREMLDGSISDQFAQRGDRFWTRRVDKFDRKTWITGAEIAAFIAKSNGEGA